MNVIFELTHYPQTFFTLTGPITIGRGDQAQIQVTDEYSSKVHVRLSFKDEYILLEDMNTKNGTTINGLKISQELLFWGDVVKFGNTELRFSPKNTPEVQKKFSYEKDKIKDIVSLKSNLEEASLKLEESKRKKFENKQILKNKKANSLSPLFIIISLVVIFLVYRFILKN
jgi:pSer/pThr/pTyr-binding forkhead associated (FHA) protein